MNCHWILLFATASAAWTATLAGKALDICQSGAPIPGVEVIVEKDGKPLPQMAGKMSILTGRDGRYSISNLPRGEVEVRFDKIKYNPKGSKKLELNNSEVLLNAEMWRTTDDHDCALRVALYQSFKVQEGADVVAAKDPAPVVVIFGKLSDATAGKAEYPTKLQFKNAGVSARMLDGVMTDVVYWSAELKPTQRSLQEKYQIIPK